MLNFYPGDISQQYTGANSFVYAGSLATGIPSFTVPNLSLGKIPLPTYVGTQAYAMNIHRGYVESYNFTVQRNMGAGFNAQLAYVGNNAVRLFAYQNLNAAGPGQGVADGLMDRLWVAQSPGAQFPTSALFGAPRRYVTARSTISRPRSMIEKASRS